MKTTKTTKTMLATMVAASSLFGTSVLAYAAEGEEGGETPTPAHGATMKSNSTISFEEDTTPTVPVDPTDPQKPILPTDPEEHEEGTPGPLSLDYVSNIRFGMNKASAKDEVYWAALETVIENGEEVDVPNHVQVTDKRGVWDGWHLTVTQEEQFYNAEAEKSLDAAVMTFNNPAALSIDGGIAPVMDEAVVLTPGQAVDIADAKEETGSGTWLMRYGKDEVEAQQSISLAVPATTTKAKGEYKAILTWDLTDAPV